MSSQRITSMVWRTLTAGERRRLLGIWTLILLQMLLETFSLGLIIPMVGLLTRENYLESIPFGERYLWTFSQGQVLVLGMGFVIVIYVLKSVFVYWAALVQQKFTNSVSVRVSQETFSKYLLQPYEFHLERNSATLISNVDNAKAIISGGLVPILVLLTDGLVSFGLFALLLYVEPVGTIGVIVLFAVAGTSIRLVTRDRIGRWGEMRKFHGRQIFRHLQQGLGGAKEIKVLGRESQFLRSHGEHLTLLMDVDRRYMMMQMLPRLSFEALTMVGLGALVFIMVGSGTALSKVLPTLGLFAATAFRVMPSIGRILASIQTISYTKPIASTVFRDLFLADERQEESPRHGEFGDAIEFRRVTFGYKDAHRSALSEVSFRISRGEAVGIIGTSGAGKSTLVDVLLGLLSPRSGTVLVDGNDIATCRRWWQDQVGYVPQTIYLTDDSLLNNIAFGLPPELIDVGAVRRALTAAQLDEFVGSLPEGLETIVGERGVRLSGGQRQRIGIARALYHDPAVLVLDEATSALDSETEAGVMEAVRELLGKKTVIIVAHRTSTVAYCSRILRFEDGELVAQGSPEELLA